MKAKILSITLTLIFSLMSITNFAQDMKNTEDDKNENIANEEKLVVVWTSGDRDVAIKMVFMYTFNAQKNGWWKDITLLVWGPSSKLLSEDKELQDYVKKMQEIGVKTIACKGCADSYGITDKLEELGITVRYTGTELTNYIKDNYKVITF